MKKILVIIGTRPEAIKFAPLIKKLENDSNFEVVVCSTGQHKEMLDQVCQFFNIKLDYNLDLMTKNQTLNSLASKALIELDKVIVKEKPEIVFVQGDTTTAFIGGLSAFHNKIKVAHLEAGLRSGDKWAPFPEEVNRKMISTFCDFHFAPTESATKALAKEGIRNNVYNVGNTVIDALFIGLELLDEKNEDLELHYPFLDKSKKLILLTAHRRENFGQPLVEICDSIKELAESDNNIQVVYPVHFNPNVRDVVNSKLKGLKNVHLIDPLPYSELIWMMNRAYIVLTDSGGIQEEAPSLGKPVLVLRDVTERMEGVEAGTAILLGTKKSVILQTAMDLIENRNGLYDKMSKANNPYGNGKSSEQIVEILKTI